MTEITVQARAQRAKRLLDSEDFQEVMRETRDSQTHVFLAPSSSMEDISEARGIIEALTKLEARLHSAVAEGQRALKREKQRGAAP